MRTLCRWCLTLSAWLACSSVFAAALDTLSSCADKASLEARGITALGAECPELQAALNELGLTVVLPNGWQDTLNRDGLRDLAVLTRRYQEPPLQAAPEVNNLRGILDALAREQQPQAPSWWDTIKTWLRSWFKDYDPRSFSWLDQWLGKLAQSVNLIGIITYALLALVLVAAIWFVVNELRTAGLLSRGTVKPASRGTQNSPDIDSTPSLMDLDSASARDKPALLLRLLVTRLLATGRLQVERYLTHRELTTRSQFENLNQRERFTHVADLAERLLYGQTPASSEQIDTVVAEGRTLLTQLDAPQSTQSTQR